MATSLIAKPQSLTPAYNPIKYIYDSTNNGEDGFKYIFDIYDSTSTKIAEYRVLPNIDGYGEIDLSRLLQNYVSFDFDSSNITYFDPTNSYYEYEVKVGEEYIEDVAYTSNLTQNGSYVKITATHSFQVGDQVTIVEDTVTNPSINGLFTVTAITTTIDFTVNPSWSEITDATEDGTVSYADKRKTVTRDIVTVSSVYVFNGALPFADWINYNETQYILDNNKDKLFTSVPAETSQTLSQDMWVNFGINSIKTGFVYFENSTGDIFKKAIGTVGGDLISMASVGVNNYGSLTLVSGSGSLVEDDVTYYDYWYADSVGTQHSQKYRINIDRRCVINFNEIAFLDRMGSIGSFAFQLRDKLTGKVSKDTYNQHLEGSVTSQEWGYDTEAQGQRNINNRIEETYELQTNWMSEDDNDYFSELVSSPQTWVKINSVYYSCIVQERGYEKVRQRNKKLIRKSIKVILSVQDVING